MKTKFTLIILFLIAKVFAQSPSATINPAQQADHCPGILNQKIFVVTFTNITTDSVENNPDYTANLSISNPTILNTTQNQYTISFSDQSASLTRLGFRHKRTRAVIAQFQFEFVKSVFQRNVFFIGSSTITIPICITSYTINFPRIKYMKTGKIDALNNTNDMFGEVSQYQYELPSGVTPVSGLTPVVGLPNTYIGTNTANVNLTNATSNYIIKVRAINDCVNTLPGNWNEIRLQRQFPTLSGPSTIRCGETDTKTFTLQNLPNTGCITSYTWLIANKGWKYNGAVPTTDITTNSPSIQLQSNDSHAAPPQNVQVIINTNNGSTTVTRSINYIAPIVNLQVNTTSANFDCNSMDFTATVTNPPLGAYSYIWNTGINSLINGAPAPQTTATPNATLYRNPTGVDPVGINVSINASCGVVSSPGSGYFGFDGCIDWPNYTVYGFAYGVYGGGNLVATVEGLASATEYQWWAYYWGQYHLITLTPTANLQYPVNFPNGDEQFIYVRAQTPSGFTNLQYVGTMQNESGFRMAATEPIKVSPNPIKDIILIEYDNKEKPYAIEIYTWKGVKVKELKATIKKVSMNVANLEKGKYLVTIRQGKTLVSKQIVK